MGDEVLFNRYAIALLEIAIEQNKTEEFRKEVKILKNIFQNSPEFCEILCDVNIDLAKKYSMIDKILASVNSDILSFNLANIPVAFAPIAPPIIIFLHIRQFLVVFEKICLFFVKNCSFGKIFASNY